MIFRIKLHFLTKMGWGDKQLPPENVFLLCHCPSQWGLERNKHKCYDELIESKSIVKVMGDWFGDTFSIQPRVEAKPETQTAPIRPRDQRTRDRPTFTQRGPRPGTAQTISLQITVRVLFGLFLHSACVFVTNRWCCIFGVTNGKTTLKFC